MSAGNILERDCDTRIAQLEAQLAEAKDLLAMTVGYWVRDEDWAQRRDALLGKE